MAGWLALVLLAASLVTLALHESLPLVAGHEAFGSGFIAPLSYLTVFLIASAAGLVALFGVALRHDHSISVILVMVLGLLAGLFLAAEALGGETGGGQGGGEPVLTEADNGQNVVVMSGQRVTIRLPGNPTTGYTWDATIADPSLVSEAAPMMFTPTTAAIGSGGTFTFVLEARGAGQTTVTIAYHRPWEPGVAPAKTFTVNLVVKNPKS